MTEKTYSSSEAIKETSSFMKVRTVSYILCTIFLFISSIISIIIISNSDDDKFNLYLGISLFLLTNIIISFFERYYMFMIKAGHAYSLAEYIFTDNTPFVCNGFSEHFNFGLKQIEDNFDSVKDAYKSSKYISTSVRNIVHYENRTGKLLSFLPGSDLMVKIFENILNTGLYAIDFSIFSYVLHNKDEKNCWKKSCDYTLYFGQTWNKMVKNSSQISSAIFFVYTIVIITGISSGLLLGDSYGLIYGIMFAWVFIYAIKRLIVEPYTLASIIFDFYEAIDNINVRTQLYKQFASVSKCFRNLMGLTNDYMKAHPVETLENTASNTNTNNISIPEQVIDSNEVIFAETVFSPRD